MLDADKINILIKEGEGLTVAFKEKSDYCRSVPSHG